MPIRWALALVWVHAALHLVVPPIMAAQRDWFAQHFRELARDRPPAFGAVTAARLLHLSLVYHLVLAFLFMVLAAFIVRGRNQARIALTILLTLGALGTAFSFSSATPAPNLYKTLNGMSWLLAFATVVLLWIPSSARHFFDRATH